MVSSSRETGLRSTVAAWLRLLHGAARRTSPLHAPTYAGDGEPRVLGVVELVEEMPAAGADDEARGGARGRRAAAGGQPVVGVGEDAAEELARGGEGVGCVCWQMGKDLLADEAVVQARLAAAGEVLLLRGRG